MILKTELQAYSAEINLPLFNSIVAFTLDTAEATSAQRAGLRRQCPFLTLTNAEFYSTEDLLFIAGLFSAREQRELFDMIAEQSNTRQGTPSTACVSVGRTEPDAGARRKSGHPRDIFAIKKHCPPA